MSDLKLNVEEWKEFKINEVFTRFEQGKCSNSTNLIDGDEIAYIGAKKSENGVIKYATKQDNEGLISKGNCICFICQGEGSSGYNNYYECDTIQTTSNVLGYNERMNKYSGLFLTTILDKERFRFSFSRGRSNTLKQTKIKLPTTPQGAPDFDFMERYIKTRYDRLEKQTQKKIKRKVVDLKKEEWKEFKINEVFTRFEQGKCSNSTNL
ncbi:MAG: restriction endonuclease subunit S, partial [Rickettsiales bacterium]|nr:restriction endonuclease subunit S [Rickettsiales bacterium]